MGNSGSRSIEDLVAQCRKLKQKLVEAQARNYELRYKDEKTPDVADMKSRIDRLETDIKNLLEQREELRKRSSRLFRIHTAGVKGGSPRC